jgi:hypothetical protein
MIGLLPVHGLLVTLTSSSLQKKFSGGFFFDFTIHDSISRHCVLSMMLDVKLESGECRLKHGEKAPPRPGFALLARAWHVARTCQNPRTPLIWLYSRRQQ